MPRRSQADLQPDSPFVNLNTIAIQLGIAVSTVSRALRNQPGIHPATRLRIQTEAARLGYAVKRRADERHQAGEMSPVRHVLTLAQTTSNLSQHGYFGGISRAAQAHDMSVLSHHCSLQEADQILNTQRQPAALRMPNLAGLIFMHRWPTEIVSRLSENRLAVSIIHRYSELPVDTVSLDDESNLRLLIAHLRERGHEKIGFFGYEPSFSWALSRFAAYVGGLAGTGLSYEPANVIKVSAQEALTQQQSDFKALLPLLRARMKTGVTAWISSSYVIAQGLCHTLRAAGYKVPDDIAVTGYHGGARILQPGIFRPTSVETDDEIIGGAAVHLLAQRAQRAFPAPAMLLLPGRIVQGDSTTP